ncbi:conserved hypothetical protein [Cupriavidus necator]|uniref:DUF1064 domain-containing protein n=1 Tax=Cupriavidus necator TaxID=106590 RepID=A0A1K0IRL9_CUPNE|nr:conserved hypothetical protein [Cupriavidus necator]
MSDASHYLAPGRQSGLQRLRALGRLKPGQMNKTEQAYERHLHARREAGEVLWYRFEGIKLRLADNTFLTIDFAVMLADGQLEMHDVKGGKAVFMDDARAKTKVAADQYPFQFRAVYPRPKREGGGWAFEDF